MSSCPCGSEQDLEACCGPIMAGGPAPSAEALMRSRYTAFTLGDLDYLERSLVTETREAFNRAETERVMREVTWLGLEIRDTAEAEDGTATVEFIARFRKGHETLAQHERARFRQEEGAWRYIDGDINPKSPPRHVVKIGRNDPCPCGSGRKYKKCCGG